jgi:hypothetical protein
VLGADRRAGDHDRDHGDPLQRAECHMCLLRLRFDSGAAAPFPAAFSV